MNEERDIKLTILIMVGLLVLMILSTVPNNNELTFKEQRDVEQILNEHNFSEWSIEDKAMLTEMMRQTASPYESSEHFIVLADAAPVHVLETYIDLFGNAGYWGVDILEP